MKLFIIGNGFDIGHKLPCKYSDFLNYLIKNRNDILEIMEKFYYVGKDSDLWSDFENSLEKNINYNSLKEIIRENAPDLGSDDFRDRDWNDAYILIEKECNKLLDSIRSGFKEWIELLDVDNIPRRYKLDRSAYYITFNYTTILEKIYKISTKNILHIHNKVGEELLFGHGRKLENFNVKEVLYGSEGQFLTIDEDGNFESCAVGHELIAEDAVLTFFDNMRKHTEEIIQNNSDYFNKLSEINEVFVLGHSYNEIDLPYFKKIAELIDKKSNWFLFYYSNEDIECAKKVMKGIKIADDFQFYKNCSELEIEDIQLNLF